MTRQWVVNASPLIVLTKINQVHLLDRAAKTAALALEIPVRGTLGVILLAKREGKVEAAKPIFEQLIQVGFRAS
ncbi:DUF3368 domain-containing protein [Nostoc sp. CHAB 5784]|uniref:DUF3368 domain-containing protein n=1 Tax=Nostoc mirabile TaxID=2907820 RepID=UPI001E5196B3|nr:DUF3368 domain-containing protein [Nostoc mirabile]MCC5665502.1 DUF3368 domain-containing protein [Nostoc mirabile CHAB5784]